MKNYLAKKIIKRYQPTVVFVGGTWGKSMFTHLASAVLGKLGNDAMTVAHETLAECLVSNERIGLAGALRRVLIKNGYPQTVFVEVHDGFSYDQALFEEIEDKVLVIPFISQYEIQQYGSLERFLQRRCLVSKARAKQMTVIYNKDVQGLDMALQEYEFANAFTFSGLTEEASFKALNLDFKTADDAHITNDHRVQGIVFKVKNGGATLPLRLNEAAGMQHVYPVLATLLLARHLDVNIVEILPSIRDLKPLPGRMKLIPGIKKTLLLDDTYDIDAETAYETFRVGSEVPLQEGKKRVAVVGDMLVHGEDSPQAHCLLGDELAGMNYDLLVGIGERSHDILRCAKDAGMDEGKIAHFMQSEDAGKFIQHEIKQGDLVVVKGPKEMMLESIIKELMAFPLKAKEELVERG